MRELSSIQNSTAGQLPHGVVVSNAHTDVVKATPAVRRSGSGSTCGSEICPLSRSMLYHGHGQTIGWLRGIRVAERYCEFPGHWSSVSSRWSKEAESIVESIAAKVMGVRADGSPERPPLLDTPRFFVVVDVDVDALADRHACADVDVDVVLPGT